MRLWAKADAWHMRNSVMPSYRYGCFYLIKCLLFSACLFWCHFDSEWINQISFTDCNSVCSTGKTWGSIMENAMHIQVHLRPFLIAWGIDKNGLNWWIVVPRYTNCFFFVVFKSHETVFYCAKSPMLVAIKVCHQPVLKDDFWPN
jgi:hypothetical protein